MPFFLGFWMIVGAFLETFSVSYLIIFLSIIKGWRFTQSSCLLLPVWAICSKRRYVIRGRNCFGRRNASWLWVPISLTNAHSKSNTIVKTLGGFFFFVIFISVMILSPDHDGDEPEDADWSMRSLPGESEMTWKQSSSSWRVYSCRRPSPTRLPQWQKTKIFESFHKVAWGMPSFYPSSYKRLHHHGDHLLPSILAQTKHVLGQPCARNVIT